MLQRDGVKLLRDGTRQGDTNTGSALHSLISRVYGFLSKRMKPEPLNKKTMKKSIVQFAVASSVLASTLWFGRGGAASWSENSLPEGQTKGQRITQQVTLAAAISSDEAGSYPQTIQPLLEQYCYQCHGPEKQKGSVRLDNLDPDMINGPDAESWHSALDMINGGEMPPESKPQFADTERRLVVDWINQGLEEATRAKQSQEHGHMRRLTKAQYTHTLNELLGVGVDFGHVLPDDGKSEMGFSNNGEVLQISPLHIDYYQEIAREALSKAIVSSDKSDTMIYRVTLGKGIGKNSPGASYGGYQTAPVNPKDFVVDILDRNGNPYQAKTAEAQARVDATRAAIGVGLRGSAGDRYGIVDNGMLMYSALPHRDVPPKSWQGPSPNMKMLIKNGYPQTGDFVFRVNASRGEPMAQNHRMISLHGRPELPAVDVANSIRTPASAFEDTTNLVLKDDGTLVPKNIATLASAKQEVEIPRVGYYRIDLVHPYVPEDAMPSYRFALDGLKRVQERLHLEPDQADKGLITTPVAMAYLKDDDYTIQLTGPFFVGFSEVLITPLDDQSELVRGLEGELGKNLSTFVDTAPYIRVYAGGRTDDGQDFLNFDAPQKVGGAVGEAATYAFKGRLENLPIPDFDPNAIKNLHANTMSIGLWNDYLVKSAKLSGPPLVVHSMELEAPYYEQWPPKTHTGIFFDSPNKGDREKYTQEVLTRFMVRAFRRPLEEGEVDRYMDFWRLIKDDYDRYEDGVQEVLVAMLCSPHFLYIVEPEPIAEVDTKIANDAFLASNLSYFLWNSPPDAQLMALAEQGKLREALPAQIDRMVQDDRIWRMVRAFSHEWLRIDRHEAMNTNIGKYKDYNRFIREDMSEETYHFVHHVLSEDLSIMNFVDSDFVTVNQNLAQFYGIPGVEGSEFRPVSLPANSRRGGLLTQGAFLNGHSDGNEAHPIKRAVWVKEKILADPPPPPPPNVPELDPDTPGFEELTLKQQLELHRDKASCVDCHLKIDPYGVVFENFDAVGRFQTEARGRAIDSASVMPDGTKVEGLKGLQAYILTKRQQDFTRSVVEHLFAYALGRDITFADEPEIERIVEKVHSEGNRFRSVIEQIILSPSFSGTGTPSQFTQASEGA